MRLKRYLDNESLLFTIRYGKLVRDSGGSSLYSIIQESKLMLEGLGESSSSGDYSYIELSDDTHEQELSLEHNAIASTRLEKPQPIAIAGLSASCVAKEPVGQQVNICIDGFNISYSSSLSIEQSIANLIINLKAKGRQS